MSLVRQPLLNPKVENKLKNELSKRWLAGMKGRDIAQELKFGVKGSPYEKLKPCYVYYYRQKFAKDEPELFPIRNKPPFAQGERRYKVEPDEIDTIEPEEFIETLNEKLPQDGSFRSRRNRSYLIVQFYTPLRVSEIIERTISDFKITKSKITINLLRKKKGHELGDKNEPISIPRVFPLVDEVVQWLQGEEWKKVKGIDKKTGETLYNLRPWKISHDTARLVFKSVFADAYPHFFRFNWLMSEANYPDTSIAELKNKTRLTLDALERYLLSPKRVEEKYDKRRVERYRRRGLIK